MNETKGGGKLLHMIHGPIRNKVRLINNDTLMHDKRRSWQADGEKNLFASANAFYRYD